MKELSIEQVRQMAESASNHLQNNKKFINDLNVFPVPDGDTGTNMGMTFGAAAAEALKSDCVGVGELLRALAKSSLRNARGNSGVILSQILRGIAEGVDGRKSVSVKDLKQAACSARDTAYRAVMKPTEGTILTVVREMAEYAEADKNYTGDAANFLQGMLTAGKESLNRTPEILPVLKQAGVVDAGGMGIVTLLEGAVAPLTQGAVIALKDQTALDVRTTSEGAEVPAAEIKYLYCTEFLIHKSPERQAKQFMAAIRPKGDCMLVIEDDEIVKVHIHTNHPGFVMEQALKLGELTNLKVDNMKYQHEERIANQTEEAPSPQPPEQAYGFVAVSAGDGLKQLFESVQVDQVVEGGQTMNPSTQDLLNAVQKINAETVFILPNNKNIILAAQQVDDLTERNVVVIPTKNVPQGISAMLVFDENEDAKTNEETMTQMMETVKCGKLTFAARDSAVNGLEIHKDDVIGMVGSDIRKVGADCRTVALELIEDMVDSDSGVISIYYGCDTPKEDAEALAANVEKLYDHLDVSLIYGGQPVYYYFIAVE